ncbi:MAG: hypothetical protein A2Z25_06875 [Planctomycetes bacterium RBG_16_55_9]|nr:MAG: hypothetical protein A2Z25_06875 [Planctomycetes bacterium RBG_16_55_9]
MEVVDKLTADFSEHPDLPRALWFIAEKYKKLKEYEKAAGIYQQIVQRHPDSPYAGKPNVDFQRAHILFLIESERNAEAQAAIDRLGANLRDNTGLLSVLDDIAGKYHSLKKYDDAIEIYNTMIKVDPHSELAAIAQQSIGWIYYSRKMYDRAIQAYRKVLNDYPESVQLAGSQYWIAQSYYRKRQYERAIEEYQKVISAYPESREALHSRRTVAVIYRFLDMDEQAISENRQFLKDYPDSVWAPGAQSRVAESYLTNGKLERAIEEYQKVVEMYPGSQAADSAEKEIIRIRNIIQRKRYLSK